MRFLIIRDTIKKMKTISVYEQREKVEKSDRMQAQHRLMCDLADGRKSGEVDGWISAEEVRNHFRIRANEK